MKIVAGHKNLNSEELLNISSFSASLFEVVVDNVLLADIPAASKN